MYWINDIVKNLSNVFSVFKSLNLYFVRNLIKLGSIVGLLVRPYSVINILIEFSLNTLVI